MSVVPIVFASVFGIATYIREDSPTNALLWFIWGAALATSMEVRALRLARHPDAAREARKHER